MMHIDDLVFDTYTLSPFYSINSFVEDCLSDIFDNCICDDEELSLSYKTNDILIDNNNLSHISNPKATYSGFKLIPPSRKPNDLLYHIYLTIPPVNEH